MQKRKINLVTLCSGYDSQMIAARRLERDYSSLEFDLIGWAEIDKYAIQAHNAIFPEYKTRNFGDITLANWRNLSGECDLMTYSTPCTSISTAGDMAGMQKGSDAASALLWETERAIREVRPKYLIMENVKSITCKRFMPYFVQWQQTVASYGYKNYWTILNSKDFGMPQNRERMFMVSVLDDHDYIFPSPFSLQRTLADVLEPEVDDYWYLKDEQQDTIIDQLFSKYELASPMIVSYTRDRKGEIIKNHLKNYANCITTWIGSMATTDQYVAEWDGLTMSCHPLSHKVEKPMPKVLSPALRATDYKCPHCVYESEPYFRIRRMTPKEAWRLMGVDDTDIQKVQNAGLSNTQMYKMAGNSIVTNCLYHIYRTLLIDTEGDEFRLPVYDGGPEFDKTQIYRAKLCK